MTSSGQGSGGVKRGRPEAGSAPLAVNASGTGAASPPERFEPPIPVSPKGAPETPSTALAAGAERPRRAVDSNAPTVVRDYETETDLDVGKKLRRAVVRLPKVVVAHPGLLGSNTSDHEPPPDPIGGRYKAIRALGQGAGGVVYEAVDEFGGQRVAVKLLWPGLGIGSRRVGREVAALRVLDLPGVARLLDEGVHNGQRFLVMTLVEGHPFPGDIHIRSWGAIARPTMALFETLHRVHEQGIIHRDLKPSNILVDDEGRPVILDFGLARGSRLGETITQSGAILGTPRYQAPEQMDGRPVDARADLYSVGVMLYEALTGHPPHEAGSVDALRFKRLSVDPTPLAREAPETPGGVAAVVDWLLTRDPEGRPQTAAEALTALQGEADLERDELLPWLGSRAAIDAIIAALSERRPIDIGGAVGSGRSRAVREAVTALGGALDVFYLTSGERPFDSLGPLVDLESLTQPDPEELLASVDAAVRAPLEDGLIIIVDDTQHLDRWSSEALARSREAGAVVRIVGENQPADVKLRPLSERDLRELFEGPDRLLHLREDGSHELYTRTSGLPLRVVREVAAWIGAGLASWHDGQLAITRESLRRLSTRPRLTAGDAAEWLSAVTGPLAELLAWVTLAWPHATPARLQSATERPGWEVGIELAELARLGAVVRREDGSFEPRGPALELPLWPFEKRRAAHATLAKLIPPGAQGRLAHLIASGVASDIADEAIVASRDRFFEGQIGAAVGLLSEALPAVRGLGAVPEEARLLVELARLALTDQTPEAIRRAHYELDRRRDLDETVQRMDALLRAALELGDTALEQASSIEAFDDLELEVVRQQVRVGAAFRRGTAAARSLLAELAPWAESLPEQWKAYYDGWLGLLRYRESAFEQAVEQHRIAARCRPDLGGRLSARINTALALLETFRLDEAEEVAASVLEDASRLRLPLFEAFAELVRRSVQYRRGVVTEPDLELASAAIVLEHHVAASVCLNEAAVAWRIGRHKAAARLASQARTVWLDHNRELPACLARALELAVRGEADEAEVQVLVERARNAAFPRVGAQILGLLSQTSPRVPNKWREEARRLAESTPSGFWTQRLEVLSLAESVIDSQTDR